MILLCTENLLCSLKRDGVYFPTVNKFEFNMLVECREPGSSVSAVSDYGLDDRAIGVRSPAGAKDFSSSLCVQPLGPTQRPVQWVGGVLSLGVKRGRGVMLTTHPYLVPRS
jgi:hypothetical protein